MNTTWTRSMAVAATLVAVGLVGACNGDLGAMGDSSAEGEAGALPPAPAARERGAATGAGGAVDGVRRTVFEVRSVIREGEISLTSKDLGAARRQVDALVDSVGGTVESEQTTHAEDGTIDRSTLVLRVPVARFFDAMSALEGIGSNQSSSTSSEDVTTEVIDVDERVQTLQNSLDRLQSYQARARTIEDLLRFEQQITQRQAELQSLEAQQAYLADQTSMSTISLTMTVPQAIVPPPDRLDDAGFLAGLESGWNALQGAVIVVLTVLGAVLPFAVVLLLLGLPTWLLVRRLVRQRPAPAGGPGPEDVPPTT